MFSPQPSSLLSAIAPEAFLYCLQLEGDFLQNLPETLNRRSQPLWCGSEADLQCLVVFLPCSHRESFQKFLPVSFLSTFSNDLLFKLAIGKMKWGSPNQSSREGAEDGDAELSRADPLAEEQRETHTHPQVSRQEDQSGTPPGDLPGALLQSCLLYLGHRSLHLCRTLPTQLRLWSRAENGNHTQVLASTKLNSAMLAVPQLRGVGGVNLQLTAGAQVLLLGEPLHVIADSRRGATFYSQACEQDLVVYVFKSV